MIILEVESSLYMQLFPEAAKSFEIRMGRMKKEADKKGSPKAESRAEWDCLRVYRDSPFK